MSPAPPPPRPGPGRAPALDGVPGLDELFEDPGRASTLSPESARALLIRCATVQTVLASCLLGPPRLPAAPASAVDTEPDREYLSIRELAARIPYAEGTIRNLMTQGRLRLGDHYIKPNGRVMFRWSAVRQWLDQAGGPRR